MKSTAGICLLFLITICFKANAQSFFFKGFQPYLSHLQQEALPNGDLIIAGILNNSIIINRLDACGNIVWSKEYSSQLDVDIVGLKVDKNQNILLGGNLLLKGNRKAYLMQVSQDGTLNYYKYINTNTADIAYSIDLNSKNEVYIYFKINIGQAGPNSDNTLAKFSPSGQLIWIKKYGFTGIWGQMCSSDDNGVLITDSWSIVKINKDGTVKWNKAFDLPYYAQNHFQIPGGYVLFRYDIGSPNRGYLKMLNNDGSTKWNGQLIEDIQIQSGILRRNGNLLFAGNIFLPNLNTSKTAKTVFLEVDTSNGNILKAMVQIEEPTQSTIVNSLSEQANGDITYSGTEQLSTLGSFFVSRMNDTLGRVSCRDSLFNLFYPRDSGSVSTAKSWQSTPVNYLIAEPTIDVKNYSLTKTQTFCSYFQTLSLDLGKDTLVCAGSKVILRPKSMKFDGYLWSNGKNTPSIEVNESNTYWLKAWVACDTITDSIQITYYNPPKLKLGNDTSICSFDSLRLFSKDTTAYWSTGDTANSIVVFKPGTYWAKIQTPCGFIRDSITVKHLPQLQKPKLGNDTSICFNDKHTLSVNTTAKYIRWSTGEKTAQIKTDSAGVYTVTIANACDTLSDTIKVDFHPKTKTSIFVSTQNAKVLDSIFFQLIKPTSYQKLEWQFGDDAKSSTKNTIHQYKKSGMMMVKLSITDSLSCTYDSSFYIEIEKLSYSIPNVFSPNGDGINDSFSLIGEGLTTVDLKIYNRWGVLIYKSGGKPWDGKTIDGKNAASNTYFYSINFKQTGNQIKTISGSIVLIR